MVLPEFSGASLLAKPECDTSLCILFGQFVLKEQLMLSFCLCSLGVAGRVRAANVASDWERR